MRQPQRGGQRANRDSLGPRPYPAISSSSLDSIRDRHLSSLPPPAVFNQLDALAGWWFRLLPAVEDGRDQSEVATALRSGSHSFRILFRSSSQARYSTMTTTHQHRLPRAPHRSTQQTQLVHDFLVQEQYWFDTEPPDPDTNLEWLGAIEAWVTGHNTLKQRGFYVDVDPQGDVLTPAGVPDGESLRQVIAQVHQIGWQLRLGEHIEVKRQHEAAGAVPPAREAEIERLRELLAGQPVDESFFEQMRNGREGVPLNDDAYGFRLPAPGSDPFAYLGKPGYEAETRELFRLADQFPDNESDR
jgi:AbiV family abortive infection protein